MSVLVRLPWVIFVRHGLVWDSTYYFYSAKSIAAGHGYAINGHPTAFLPVGWPAFLGGVFALTGPSIWTVLVVNLLLWAVITALVYLLARRVGGRATGLIAALIVATSPTLTLYVLRAYSEALFIPLLLLVCLLLTAERGTPKLRTTALAGVCLGFAILVRSTATPLPVILSLWLLLRRPMRESWRAALALCAVSAAVVAPWILRNELVMHAPVLSTNGGFTLYLTDRPWPPHGKHTVLMWAIASARDEVQQNLHLTHLAESYMLHDTSKWLEAVPGKFINLMSWAPAPILTALHFQHGPHPLLGATFTPPASVPGPGGTLIRGGLDNTWIFRVWHYAFWTVGGVAMLLALWRRKQAAGLILLLVLFWIVFHSVFFFGDARFMISVTPLVAVPLAWMLARGLAMFRGDTEELSAYLN